MGYEGWEGPPTKWFPDFVAGLPDMSGKTVAITGTTSGTGLVAAKTCVTKGATVFMLNRQSERADKALKAVQEAVAGQGSATHVECDLQSFASVRQAADTLSAHLGDRGLNVLCHNAGIMSHPDKVTQDSCSAELQTNHLSCFLLASLLLPKLEATAGKDGARIVLHSSGTRKLGPRLDPKYFKKGTEWGGDSTEAKQERYHQSKLANVLFMCALQDRLAAKGSRIRALSCVPGFAITDIAQNSVNSGSTSIKWVMTLLPWAAQSAEDGTMPLLHCICTNEVPPNKSIVVPKNAGVLGCLIRDGMTGPPVVKPLEAMCRDEASQAALWEVSQEACGVTFL